MSITAEVLAEVALSRGEYDQIVELLGREPTPVELGMFGAMWSEHCGYKNSRPLLGRFPTSGPFVAQGPGENAGAVDIGDGLVAVLKIESHNHPSAVEPYQGAATGVGGIVRDIFTMGARPIAILDSLRFGPLIEPRNRYLFSGVVGGIGGYGNCLGIPTVAGDVFFDAAYTGNPLVNAMCVGVARRDELMHARASGVGNLVLVVGADTGRDGIHGATFASVEDPEKSHRGVVQVGNPFLEKLLLEACLEVLKTPHVVAMQDLGAAGLTSSAVESASRGGVGIDIDVARVSRREAGMTPYEVMLSESQERMLVIVTPEGLDEVRAIFAHFDLHSDVIGTVTGDGIVRVRDGDEVVAEIPARLLTDECPVYVREGREAAEVAALRTTDLFGLPDLSLEIEGWLGPDEALLALLRSPNIGSREPVTRTYDSTILTNTVLPPLVGDAAVLRVKGTMTGLAVKTDCNPRYCYLEPYLGGMHAVAEAARNVSCVGAEPMAITDCLNFGNPERPEIYYQLSRAIDGMAAACRSLQTPVVSGNVSLYNESGDEAILPTPTVGMVGRLPNVRAAVGMGFVPGGVVYLVGPLEATVGASEYLARIHGMVAGSPPDLDLDLEARVQRATREAVWQGLVAAAHDCSEGGIAVALAESCITGGVGGRFEVAQIFESNLGRLDVTLFGEAGSRVLLQAVPGSEVALEAALARSGVPVTRLGVAGGADLAIDGMIETTLAEVTSAWRSALER
ncbi:MAG TPA: phosphoribosylformylglycinamidine synthase subunit PurL [Thermomicrobiaceae bacterium]|nr:phosphoribosylformylglycinamidine synthase subunit PurL [Thermomicrobiaceae bacterium]